MQWPPSVVLSWRTCKTKQIVRTCRKLLNRPHFHVKQGFSSAHTNPHWKYAMVVSTNRVEICQPFDLTLYTYSGLLSSQARWPHSIWHESGPYYDRLLELLEDFGIILCTHNLNWRPFGTFNSLNISNNTRDALTQSKPQQKWHLMNSDIFSKIKIINSIM